MYTGEGPIHANVLNLIINGLPSKLLQKNL